MSLKRGWAPLKAQYLGANELSPDYTLQPTRAKHRRPKLLKDVCRPPKAEHLGDSLRNRVSEAASGLDYKLKGIVCFRARIRQNRKR